jgi:hypothetical protein
MILYRYVVRRIEKQFSLRVVLQQRAVLEDEGLVVEWLDAVRRSALQKN